MENPLGMSKATLGKVQAAKSYIQHRYKHLQEYSSFKKSSWETLHRRMLGIRMSFEDQRRLKKQIAREETNALREYRRKVSIQEFVLVKIIGKGAFGEVGLCRWGSSSEPVAVKRMKKKEMVAKNKLLQLREERNILAESTRSKWLVHLYCSFQDEQYLYLVMEYLPGGDLMSLLIAEDIFSHRKAQFYAAEMVLALEEVHRLNYVHRDFKPDNILLDAEGHIRLSDFGLCRHLPDESGKLKNDLQLEEEQRKVRKEKKMAYSGVGTVEYVAPEVNGGKGYTESVDWWSLGVVVYQMLVGCTPFKSATPAETLHQIRNFKRYLSFPDHIPISASAENLIRRLIADSEERIGRHGAAEIKAHPFFSAIDWNTLRNTPTPYVPQLHSKWDTHHFDSCEQEQPWITTQQPNNIPFFGYQFKSSQYQNQAFERAFRQIDQQQARASAKAIPAELFTEDYSIVADTGVSSNNHTRVETTISRPSFRSQDETSKLREEARYKLYYGDTPEKTIKPLLQKQTPEKPTLKQSPLSREKKCLNKVPDPPSYLTTRSPQVKDLHSGEQRQRQPPHERRQNEKSPAQKVDEQVLRERETFLQNYFVSRKLIGQSPSIRDVLESNDFPTAKEKILNLNFHE